MNTLTGFTLPPCRLSPGQLDAMYALMTRTYGGCTRKKFLADLDGKDSVLLLADATGAVQGFTTMLVFDAFFDGRPVKVFFSGDTVISEESRGSLTLMTAWWQAAYAVQQRFPDLDLYWLLISKGWRTYKFCPLFFKEFYPRKDAAPPPAMRRFMESVGRERFAGAYRNGLVIPHEPDYLLSGRDDVPERKKDDADVRFFLECNPEFYKGHELLCVARLHPENLTSLSRRLFHKRLERV